MNGTARAFVVATGMVVCACSGMREMYPAEESYGPPDSLSSDPRETALVMLDFELLQWTWTGDYYLSIDAASVSGPEFARVGPIRTGVLGHDMLGVLFQLPPGKYQITRLDGTNTVANQAQVHQLLFHVSSVRDLQFEAEAGAATYIGRLKARAKKVDVVTGEVFSSDVEFSWSRDPKRELKVWQTIQERYPSSRWDAVLDQRIASLETKAAATKP